MHRDFYDERRESDANAPGQGGKTSGVQLAENVQPQGQPAGDHASVTGVTAAEGGAKRGGFFKKRDYE